MAQNGATTAALAENGSTQGPSDPTDMQRQWLESMSAIRHKENAEDFLPMCFGFVKSSARSTGYALAFADALKSKGLTPADSNHAHWQDFWVLVEHESVKIEELSKSRKFSTFCSFTKLNRDIGAIVSLWGIEPVEYYKIDEEASSKVVHIKSCATKIPNWKDFALIYRLFAFVRHQHAKTRPRPPSSKFIPSEYNKLNLTSSEWAVVGATSECYNNHSNMLIEGRIITKGTATRIEQQLNKWVTSTDPIRSTDLDVWRPEEEGSSVKQELSHSDDGSMWPSKSTPALWQRVVKDDHGLLVLRPEGAIAPSLPSTVDLAPLPTIQSATVAANRPEKQPPSAVVDEALPTPPRSEKSHQTSGSEHMITATPEKCDLHPIAAASQQSLDAGSTDVEMEDSRSPDIGQPPDETDPDDDDINDTDYSSDEGTEDGMSEDNSGHAGGGHLPVTCLALERPVMQHPVGNLSSRSSKDDLFESLFIPTKDEPRRSVEVDVQDVPAGTPDSMMDFLLAPWGDFERSKDRYTPPYPGFSVTSSPDDTPCPPRTYRGLSGQASAKYGQQHDPSASPGKRRRGSDSAEMGSLQAERHPKAAKTKVLEETIAAHLDQIESEAALPGASGLCISRRQWFPKGLKFDTLPFVSLQEALHGDVDLTAPLIVLEDFTDSQIHSWDWVRGQLEASAETKVEATNVRTGESQILTVTELLDRIQKGEPGWCLQNLGAVCTAHQPTWTLETRYCILDAAISKGAKLENRPMNTRAKSFTLIGSQGAFYHPRVAILGGTWMRVLRGRCLISIVPWPRMDGEWSAYADSDGRDWHPQGKQCAYVVEAGEVVYFPQGWPYAILSTDTFVAVGKWDTIWDKRNIIGSIMPLVSAKQNLREEQLPIDLPLVIKGLKSLVELDPNQFARGISEAKFMVDLEGVLASISGNDDIFGGVRNLCDSQADYDLIESWAFSEWEDERRGDRLNQDQMKNEC